MSFEKWRAVKNDTEKIGSVLTFAVSRGMLDRMGKLYSRSVPQSSPRYESCSHLRGLILDYEMPPRLRLRRKQISAVGFSDLSPSLWNCFN